jgi:Caspase domain
MTPKLHALFIGVSDYSNLCDEDDGSGPERHLGLHKLRSPALTAYRMHEWLKRREQFLPLPLGSCRMLLSPSQSELSNCASLITYSTRATLDNTLSAIDEWRTALADNPENIGFFYFAGHGVKRERRDDVLLLEGFGEKPNRILGHCIDSTSLVDGMAPSREFPNIARTQLYFFDACRVKPAVFKKYEKTEAEPIWDQTELSRKDDRAMLILFTTVAGAKAYGIPGEQSAFSRALIRCLDGAAAESSDPELTNWSVTGLSLAKHLQTQLDQINREYQVEQLVEVGKTPVRDFLLNRLDGPPLVNVSLQIEPERAREYAEVCVLDHQDKTAWRVPFPVKPLPHPGTIPAGMYTVTTADRREAAEWTSSRRALQATPTINKWTLKVAPIGET